jgi:hypothetical protein
MLYMRLHTCTNCGGACGTAPTPRKTRIGNLERAIAVAIVVDREQTAGRRASSNAVTLELGMDRNRVLPLVREYLALRCRACAYGSAPACADCVERIRTAGTTKKK